VASDRIQQRISDIRGGGTAEPNDINPRDWLADILACHLARPAQRFPILELEATEHRNRDLTAHVWQNEPNFQQKKFSEMESAFLSLDALNCTNSTTNTASRSVSPLSEVEPLIGRSGLK
jgi:hypothetical protein